VRPYLKNKSPVLVHICNASYSGGRVRSIVAQGWPEQKQEALSEKQNKNAKVVRVVEHPPGRYKASARL
jgi:hypothetical protein